MGSGPSGAPIYLLGKELTTHYQSSFVALYPILYDLLQGWCTPVLCCIIFLGADHRTTSTTLSRIWCVGRNLSGCSSTIVAPKVWGASAKCALPPSSIYTPPDFLMTSIPRTRSNPNGLLFTTSTFVFKGFLLVTVKVMLPTPWIKRHFLPAVRIAVLFRTSGRQNIPLTTDEEQPESTNAIRSILLIFTFITGSTSSLCGERVMPASRSLPRFTNTSMRHVLVAGTDNSVSPGALFVICPGAANSLWQSDWDLHTCSTALRVRSVCRGLKVGPQAHEEKLGVARPPQQQGHRPLPLPS